MTKAKFEERIRLLLVMAPAALSATDIAEVLGDLAAEYRMIANDGAQPNIVPLAAVREDREQHEVAKRVSRICHLVDHID